MSSRHLLFLLATVAFATHGYGQSGVITGLIRDSNGNPVPNATFEIDAMSGDDLPIVSGGFTNASGVFTTTITPVGDYRVTIFPPPAPQSLAIVARIEDIVVSSTPNNLGTIVLQLGVQVSGRVVNTAGTPLVEVDLEFLVGGPSGEPLDFSNPHTNGAGLFTVAMPFGQSDLRFEPGAPPYYGGSTTAPLSMSLDLAGPRNLGDVVLPNGWGLTATVRRQSDGTPVADATVELIDSVTGVVAFVPKDKSDEFGSFSTTLAAGTYDLHIRPREDDLAALGIQHLVFPPGGPLGTIYLQDGFALTGTVRGVDGSKHAGVEVSLADPVTGARVYVGDPVLTKGSGRYEALVPSGTFDLTFSPPFSIPFGRATVQGVVVSDDTTRDGTLPALPFYSTTGAGTPGTGGITPAISSTGGTPRIGNSGYTLHCAQGCGGANAIAVFSLGEVSGKLAQHGVSGPGSPPRQLIGLSGIPGTPGSGSGDMPLSIPMDAGLAGRMLHGRFIVLDPAAPGGRARTNELQATLQL